jgi:hypothetical protein
MEAPASTGLYTWYTDAVALDEVERISFRALVKCRVSA